MTPKMLRRSLDRPLTRGWFLALMLAVGVSSCTLGYEWGRLDGALQQLHSTLQGSR